MSSLTKVSEEQFKNFEKRKRASLINSLSGYKSVNLIGSKNFAGQTNLSVISSAFHLGSDPALIGFIIRPDLVPRHTLMNLRETKFCTLNHVHPGIFKKAHQTSARYDHDQSEFEACDLTAQVLDDFHAPFVEESKLKISLKMVREVPIEENGTHLIICGVQDIYFADNIMGKDGFLNLDEIDSMCVSGLDSYHLPAKVARLSYAKPNKEVFEID